MASQSLIAEKACGPSAGNVDGELTLDGSVPIIEITGLWTKYGRTVVHQDLNLAIERGEILSIVGGSGTGKTVLLRQMLGLERATRGCVRVFGEDITKADSAAVSRTWRAALRLAFSQASPPRLWMGAVSGVGN